MTSRFVRRAAIFILLMAMCLGCVPQAPSGSTSSGDKWKSDYTEYHRLLNEEAADALSVALYNGQPKTNRKLTSDAAGLNVYAEQVGAGVIPRTIGLMHLHDQATVTWNAKFNGFKKPAEIDFDLPTLGMPFETQSFRCAKELIPHWNSVPRGTMVVFQGKISIFPGRESPNVPYRGITNSNNHIVHFWTLSDVRPIDVPDGSGGETLSREISEAYDSLWNAADQFRRGGDFELLDRFLESDKSLGTRTVVGQHRPPVVGAYIDPEHSATTIVKELIRNGNQTHPTKNWMLRAVAIQTVVLDRTRTEEFSEKAVTDLLAAVANRDGESDELRSIARRALELLAKNPAN